MLRRLRVHVVVILVAMLSLMMPAVAVMVDEGVPILSSSWCLEEGEAGRVCRTSGGGEVFPTSRGGGTTTSSYCMEYDSSSSSLLRSTSSAGHDELVLLLLVG